MGKRQAFCMQRIPETECVRKETVNMKIIISFSKKMVRKKTFL